MIKSISQIKYHHKSKLMKFATVFYKKCIKFHHKPLIYGSNSQKSRFYILINIYIIQKKFTDKNCKKGINFNQRWGQNTIRDFIPTNDFTCGKNTG